MYYNDQFTPDEWEYLQLSIPIIFHAIASADNKIDKKEKNAMKIILDNSGAFDSELMNELLESIKIEPDELLQNFEQKAVSYKDGLKHINRLLDYKLERKEAMDFKKTLIAIGTYIGDSSGKFLHRKLSQDEEDTLQKVGKYLDVPVKELFMTKILDRLLSKVKEV
jgi:uncharacterized tellurite resistance protein B-like protein